MPKKSAQPKEGARLQRDVEGTKRRLVAATLRVLGDGGFADLGVNRVAREAGVDKVLVYRYFGGLTELVKSAAASTDFWPTFEELAGDTTELEMRPPAEQVAIVLRRFAHGLQRRPLALEILAWETVARTEHTAAFESVREELALRLGRLLGERLKDTTTDAPALIAVLAGAINYLSVRRRSIRVFNDVEIGTEAGWARIDAIVTTICQDVLGAK